MREITVQQEWLDKPNKFLYSYNEFQKIRISAWYRREDVVNDNDPVASAKKYAPLIKTIRFHKGSMWCERQAWFVTVYDINEEPFATDIRSIGLFIIFALRSGSFDKIDQTDLKNFFYQPPTVHDQTYAHIITQLADYPVAMDTFVRWCLDNLNQLGFIIKSEHVSIREVVKSGIVRYIATVHDNPEMKMVFIRIMEDYGLRDENKEMRL